MKRNNTKLLTPRQLDELINKYDFVYDSNADSVLVECKNYQRITAHPANEKFFINSKIRKVTFTTDALDLWKKYFLNHNLFEVQNVVNSLYLTYQPITRASVEKGLNDSIFKIKTIN